MSYRIDPGAPLSSEIRRIGIEQIHEAVVILDAGRSEPDGGAHEARKRFKRLRGLVRLIAAAAPDIRRQEEHCIKDIAASLSVIRDATAIVEAIDRFADDAEEPQEIDHLAALRRHLLARRDRILEEQGTLDETIDRAIEGLRIAENAFDGMRLSDTPEDAAELLARSMKKTWIGARKALRKAGKKGRDKDFHELRKSVKYHEMHLQLLGGACPGMLRERWKRVERLGDRLGDLHDIPVLAETIESEKIGGKADRKFVRRMMLRKRKDLGAECLEKSRKLFKASAEEVARSVAIHYALASAEKGGAQAGATERDAVP